MKFKKFAPVVALLLIALCCSCTPNREDRAQSAIDNYMKLNFVHYDSYEPLEMEIDSSYTSLQQNEMAINAVTELLNIINSANEYREEIDRAEYTMDSYSYYKGAPYNRAKRDRDKYQILLDRSREKALQTFDNVKSIDRQINIGEFNGWIVFHKYKFHLNYKGRDYDKIDTVIFLCDHDFKIKAAYSVDEYNTLVAIMNSIKESDDMESWFDKLQDMAMANKHIID